ncbi:MAG: molybdate ABC transporter substrate-binding protein [Polaromonas sp.]
MQFPTLNRVVAALALATVASAALAGDITVSAASSLTNAFKDIAQNYQVLHPDAKVALNFGASGALLQQIAKGAPVDVFASADQETMDQAQKQGLVAASERVDFVRNHLVLITPLDSKLVVKQLADLNRPAVARVAIGNPASVPVGRYTQQALEAAKLWPALQTKVISTQNVRQSLDYVARGEVDAGFVYATDAALMKDKVKVAMQVPLQAPILYPMARISASPHAAEAQRFMAYVQSPVAQTVLAHYGFGKP